MKDFGSTEIIIHTNGLGHITKMAATPIDGKTPIKNLLLKNQRADCNETCYVAFGMGAHYN